MGYSPEEATILINRLKSQHSDAIDAIYFSGGVNIVDFNAKGDGVVNDVQAVIDAINYAKKNGFSTILFPDGYTFLLDSPNGTGTTYSVDVPDGFTFVVNGSITGSTSKVINWNIQGSFTCKGKGSFTLGQGQDARYFQIHSGTIIFDGIKASGVSSTVGPTFINVPSPASGTIDLIRITNCTADKLRYFYLREQTNTDTHVISKTEIIGNSISNCWNGSGILINAVSGLDSDILIANNVIDTVLGDSYGDGFSGFGIAVAGVNTRPFVPTSTVNGVVVSGNLVKNCKVPIHVEYSYNVLVDGNYCYSIAPSYYPVTTECYGIVVYGSDNITVKNNTVQDVTSDLFSAWGIGVLGSYFPAAQPNRNVTVEKNTLRNCSFIMDQNVLVTAAGSNPAYELTQSSRLVFSDNVVDNGSAVVYSTGTLIVRNNTITSKLSYGPLTVTQYGRAANVATLRVTIGSGSSGLLSVLVGDLIAVQGVGSGFDTQSAAVTSVTKSSTYADITYANTGANVGTTSGGGSVYWFAPALYLNLGNNTTGVASVNSVYRMALVLENNRAANVYGQSSFFITGLPASRYNANISFKATGNNFGVDTSAWHPLVPINRSLYTAQGSVPTGAEYVVGDQISINIGGGGAHKNYITTGYGYVGIIGDTYAIVSAPAGTIRRTGATSWLGTIPVYVVGQKVLLTNGAASIVGIVQKLELSGGNEVMTVVDPATGGTLDLTSVGGPGTIAVNDVATFVLF